jgi:hypothetical protein
MRSNPSVRDAGRGHVVGHRASGCHHGDLAAYSAVGPAARPSAPGSGADTLHRLRCRPQPVPTDRLESLKRPTAPRRRRHRAAASGARVARSLHRCREGINASGDAVRVESVGDRERCGRFCDTTAWMFFIPRRPSSACSQVQRDELRVLDAETADGGLQVQERVPHTCSAPNHMRQSSWWRYVSLLLDALRLR